MNGTNKKLNGTITKTWGVSIGLVVIIIGAVFWLATTVTGVEADIENVQSVTANLNETFVPRRELNQRLSNIEESQVRQEASILRIEKFIIK